MLYTIDFEYNGGTYLSQVEAADLREVLPLWLKQTADKELARWSVKRSLLADDFCGENPVQVEGLKNVWCVARVIHDSLALANIITTSAKT